ncbi:MAG TPA: hypothetical protein VMV32_01735 [Ignavibacteriaceae bacterium]|nr:hypothetical protein [Ignavibacteriaceae bacterium]
MADSFLNIKLSRSRGNRILKINNDKAIILDPRRLPDKKILKKQVKEIAELIRYQIFRNILEGKRYDGKNVAGLALSTIRKKGSSRPLVDTGKMAYSVVVAEEGGKTVVRMSRNRYPKKGKGSAPTVEEVAGYLQTGNSKMPARPFFGITKKDLNNFVKIVIKDRLFK